MTDLKKILDHISKERHTYDGWFMVAQHEWPLIEEAARETLLGTCDVCNKPLGYDVGEECQGHAEEPRPKNITEEDNSGYESCYLGSFPNREYDAMSAARELTAEENRSFLKKYGDVFDAVCAIPDKTADELIKYLRHQSSWGDGSICRTMAEAADTIAALKDENDRLTDYKQAAEVEAREVDRLRSANDKLEERIRFADQAAAAECAGLRKDNIKLRSALEKIITVDESDPWRGVGVRIGIAIEALND